MSGKRKLYNALWDEEYAPLQIELECIKRGGKWISSTGRECGAGLFEHYMTARKLAWPKRYRHSWTDLMYHNFIENDVTILMGAASTQKTSHAVEFVVLSYAARPENTLAILSTVNMDKLDIGVWAELTKLWNEAYTLHPWFPGHIVAYKRAITTDSVDDDGVRLFTKGCICRPCFPKGTLVDTPNGQVPIEAIKEGDIVLNAVGQGAVRACSETIAPTLLRILLHDKRVIDCTPEHPFFTQSGWKKAVDLENFDVVFSADETVQMLRSENNGKKDDLSEILQGMCQSHAGEEMRTMRENVEAVEKSNRKVLQQEMLVHMGGTKQNSVDFKMPPMRKILRDKECEYEVLLGQMSSSSSGEAVPQVREVFHFDGAWPEAFNFLQSILLSEVEGQEDFKNQQLSNNSRIGCLEFVSGKVSVELSGENRQEKGGRTATLVQGGRGILERETCGGSGRWSSQNSIGGDSRQGTRGYFNGAWVESVEVLQQAGDDRFRESEGGYRVHNLEVAGHPSYSVNGVVVHNCYVGGKNVGLGVLAGVKQDNIIYLTDELQFMPAAFSGSWPHLFSNGNVKIIGSGNPKHDPEDELSIAACPIGGWESHPEPEVTTVWRTKFMGAKCVNLVGTDSDNFKSPADKKEPFARLIGRQFADRMAHDHGKDSFEYYRLVKGVMKVGFALSRVITRQICRDHRALEQPVWADDNQTKGYAIDPSYGGEDRCVGGPFKFGKDANGLEILWFGPYKTFPISLQRADLSAEDQIAEVLEQELTFYSIPPEHVFYDATGKGTLGAAFARKFGFHPPVAIDSGARPTKRPVRADLFVDDPVEGKRLKRCDEHYSKFVSEMWYSTRYVIEADQFRGLAEDVMAEGCARIYYVVAGNKIEVEPKSDPKKKDDLKRRLGKSPDLFDYTVIGVEGARQLGFTIGRLGENVPRNEKESDDYFETEAKEWENAIKERLLVRE